ncbi:3-hydroxyacyl-CoA dehydrogenase NAD-binding domain-containing protein [Aromatoleum diolicum]|uniref:Enoyl-CoA hydratase n=1 Tax=Aromatoleum diolicum TaxID=75796 RepID=A0ABX1QG15_9RHOO|nr:3-hydroxyacyl-CoA dehydrogenase NAD-binding domain-containing protein [Aromatoleum diolicum]NMG76445.1 enoyl-CoA hydratase [Aromatoleum diolicum]
MDSPVVTLTRNGAIAVVTIDRPPVNALSADVRRGLLNAFEELAGDPSVAGAVLACAGRTFVAGAEISEFGTDAFSEADPNDVHAAIENLNIPVVCALHGTTLGGGMELALACHYRVATPTAKLGLPEVTLGLLPGGGGTQRLPRLIGAADALDMMLSGAPVSAQTALDKDLIDVIVEGNLLEAAQRFVGELIATRAPLRLASEGEVDRASVSPTLFADTRAALAKKARGAIAPARIVDCVEAAITMPFADGLKYERDLFVECMNSPQSAALRHAFFAERDASKIPGIAKDVPLRPIRKVGIVGAGTMGGGIAMNFLNAGIPVILLEVKPDALERGLGIVRKNYEATANKGRMTLEQVEQRMALCSGSLDYVDLHDCDLVIEAVFESMDVKKAVMARLGEVCKPGAIIATNTSTLDVDVLAAASGRAADVVGMHFFSPANVMRLLEVVRGRDTDPAVLATVMTLARKIKKVAVVSGVCFGFIGNRMLEPYLRECEALLLEGATPTQIDRAIEAFGMAMGPCRMIDMAGVDVAAKVVLERRKDGALPADPGYRVACQMLFELGRHGQKTGAGYYRYEGRTPVHDAEVDRIMEGLAKQYGIARRNDVSDEEIVERCLYPLINEGAKILEEGIAYRAGDIDIVWLNGYGFPALKGGPMHAANVIGLEQIVACLEHYAGQRGNAYGYWTVAGLVGDLAVAEREFGDA